MTLTTLCGTDVHILKGEYPVRPMPRVHVSGAAAQCSHAGDGFEALGGWRFGNTINGCQAEYVLVPNAQYNLAKIPSSLRDEEVILCPDIMSTGFSASERGRVRLRDAVAVFAQGPIGLCATAGAKRASLVIGIDRVSARLEMAKRMGADVVLNYEQQDVVAEIKKRTGGGVYVAIEALGTQATFENALRAVHPGGTVSSLGVYSGHLAVPLDAIAAAWAFAPS